MNYEQRQEKKKEILILASKSEFPITPNQISEKCRINYTTAVALLFELLNEGFKTMWNPDEAALAECTSFGRQVGEKI